jgi:DNA-directed RNA polymerase specialized sigma subunit
MKKIGRKTILNDNQKKYIRIKFFENGIKQRYLAAEYEVSQSTISRIINEVKK